MLRDHCLADLRYACRTLRRSPVFTATAVACLALGIGANTAVFTVIDRVLLRPLPFPDPGRIVTIGRKGPDASENPRRYAFWQTQDLGFENLAAWQGASSALTGVDRPQMVRIIAASHRYFTLFDARPVLGRVFSQEEDRPGAPCAAVLSHAAWQRHFGASPEVLRKSIKLDGALCDIAGVLAPGFVSYPQADLWVPLQLDPATTNQASTLTVAGRLPRGVTLAQANARMDSAEARYRQHFPASVNSRDVQVAPLRNKVAGNVGPLLLLLWGAVGLVLLIACVNVANMLLARGAVRRREIAIRAAIGASRRRIAGQLVTESLLLALAGASLGLLGGQFLLEGVLAITPGELPRAQELSTAADLDPRMAAFTLLLAVITALLFGLAPALRLSSAALTPSLKGSDGCSGTGFSRNGSLSLLASAEIALSTILLSAAMLLIRSFLAMHAVSLGFEPTGLLTMQISLAGPSQNQDAETSRVASRIVERLKALPGVESAAVASALPLYGRADMIFQIPGRALPPDQPFTGDVQWRYVTPEYFETLRIPLLRGRLLRTDEPRPAMVISREMARRFWPDGDPVGQTIVLGPRLGPGFELSSVEIAGIVGDVRERFEFTAGSPIFYMLASQIPDGAIALLNRLEATAVLVRVRSGGSAQSLAPAAEQAVLAAARVPASNVRTMVQAGIDSTPRHNFQMLLLAIFAAAATLLAAVGIYGVMAYGVERSRREIGIRTALGAARWDAVRLVLGRAIRISGAGIVSGTLAALGLTRLLEAQLFGIAPTDPATFLTVPAILLATAVLAALGPALRAGRVAPMEALRAD